MYLPRTAGQPLRAQKANERKTMKTLRTAMGEYVVPPGGKPLTALADATPGPSTYAPNVQLVKPSAPTYSLGDLFKSPTADYEASPADVNISGDMIWPHKSLTLKGKGKLTPYDIEGRASAIFGQGAAAYAVHVHEMGSGGPKWSLAARHLEGVNTGPPNRLVQPTDTRGVATPAPAYRPGSKYWHRGPKFGNRIRHKLQQGPGPGEYQVCPVDKYQRAAPAYSMLRKLPAAWQQRTQTDGPGPAAYDVRGPVDTATAKSLSGKHPAVKHDVTPGPDLYEVSSSLAGPSAHLTSRWFDKEAKPHPDPTSYECTLSHLPRAPTYSIRQKTRPSYPDLLNYPQLARPEPEPGPGSYQDNRNMLSKNDQPKYTIARRIKSRLDAVPGPGHYSIPRTAASRAPSFTRGKRFTPSREADGPGPAGYYPQLAKGRGKGAVITKRPKSRKAYVTPAPNAYNIAPSTLHAPGASLKGRSSPYVYSGI